MHKHYQKIIFARQGGVSDPHALLRDQWGWETLGYTAVAKMSKNYM